MNTLNNASNLKGIMNEQKLRETLDEYLTATEAAEKLKCSTRWIYYLIQNGRLHPITIFRKGTFYSRSEVEKLKNE